MPILMRRRTRYSLLAALALILALVVAAVLRKTAPPETARLLPESDAIVYVDLQPIRAATHFDRKPIQASADYQNFIDATGIVFDRDVDSVAFGLHRMENPNGPNGPVAYSEVMEGSFDGKRLTAWLAKMAASRESYAGRVIYTIPIDGRSLRVAMLGYDMVAASNMPTPEQIHSILDRYHAGASPFSGSSLLEERYHDVPLLSVAWGIGHIGLPFGENGRVVVGGLTLPLPVDTTFVASLRYAGSLHLRVEEIAGSEDAAGRQAETLNALLNIFKGLQPVQAAGPEDASIQEFIKSLKIEQKRDRAVLTGTLPVDLMKKVAAPEDTAK